jgi:hypothetical protein
MASRRAAAAREVEAAGMERRSPSAALRAALSLVQVAGACHGWPLSVDPRDDAEDLRAYERWARLRRSARP